MQGERVRGGRSEMSYLYYRFDGRNGYRILNHCPKTPEEYEKIKDKKEKELWTKIAIKDETILRAFALNYKRAIKKLEEEEGK